jgi:hypothetical protein
MKRFIITLLSCAALASSASALEIAVTPGSLKSSILQISTTQDSKCKLTGEASAEDLALLKNISSHVYELDLSELTVPDNEIPDYFIFDTRVSRVLFPEGIKKIGKSAFAATSVKILTLPSTLEYIGDYAYSGCTQLQAASFPENVQCGVGVFKDCTTLNLVKFEKGPNSIAAGMFEGCTSLNFSIPEEVTEIGNNAFRMTSIKTADLQNVTKVGDFAFADCPQLSGILLSAVNNIEFGKGVFFLDQSLSDIPEWDGNLPDLFAGNVTATVPNVINVPVIGEGAYANNAAIDSITLGNQVVEIKANAFRNATNLATINAVQLGASVPTLSAEGFSGLEGEDGRYSISLNVKQGTADIWKEDAVWSLFNINETTGVENTLAATEISVLRNNGVITVTADQPIEAFDVYSIGGVHLFGATPMSLTATASGIDEDVVIVRVQAGKSIKITKLF